ncbi:type II toxin-antitoxin system HipA family toxin [Variovorax sp. J2P1-59]|uniref:type II toxin-antitoxin system HipA family toxin n=1 Tax=Variovorax flavidus TaxID=3053501 RepID=UPI0025773469|nr:type II toxin-antitoxin system HipA family toxin [Variovorax sp. J2P1-59]MDM0075252.1 type II toxin-antitoxin system HipA family toxin [Variovorax sp. J2P1-59]
MSRPDRLDLFHGEDRVASVHDSAPLEFEYTAEWLARAEPLPVAAIPLAPGRQSSAAVQAFLENLLPEGELRDYLAQQKKASTLFSLLYEVAGDTAGAFVILPAGERPEPPSYEATSWQALAGVLASKSASAIDIKGHHARISLAGAQDKASLALFEDGIPRLPRGTSPSTHILKPDIRRLAKVWHSAANEAATMRAAAMCGLPTADVFYEPNTQACVVKRFDRIERADGTLGRLLQYDLCQLAGTVSEKKYEVEGGPGAGRCAELIRQYSTQPAVDLKNFVAWIFFNLYSGNNDSHAKNLSLYRVPGTGMKLTPFYDLMCTRIYPALSPQFAFSIGGETMPGAISRAHAVALAETLGMRPAFVLGIAEELAGKMPGAIGDAVASISPDLSPGARTLARRLEQFVVSTTRQISSRLLQAS